MSKEYDLVIVGAGMVGASLALALGDSGLRIALVESVRRGSLRQPSYDDRGIALSLSSRRIFEAMGIWPKLSAVANPIRKVHVSDQGQFGKVRMDADSLRLEALGYVVVARELGNVLLSSLDDYANIDLLCPARNSFNLSVPILDLTVGFICWSAVLADLVFACACAVLTWGRANQMTRLWFCAKGLACMTTLKGLPSGNPHRVPRA